MKNNDVVIEGNATKTTAFSGFSIGNNTYLLDADNIYTFYADFPKFTLSSAIGACNVSGGSKKKKRKTKKSNKKRKARARTRKYH